MSAEKDEAHKRAAKRVFRGAKDLLALWGAKSPKLGSVARKIAKDQDAKAMKDALAELLRRVEEALIR